MITPLKLGGLAGAGLLALLFAAPAQAGTVSPAPHYAPLSSGAQLVHARRYRHYHPGYWHTGRPRHHRRHYGHERYGYGPAPYSRYYGGRRLYEYDYTIRGGRYVRCPQCNTY